MKHRIGYLGIVTVALQLVAAQTQSGKSKPEGDPLIGDWLGDSICVVHPSACHDEKALYRIKKSGGTPNDYSIEADKIVDGKPVSMGTMECTYAAERHALTCSTSKLLLHLTLDGKNLTGTMNLADGTVWRNITLRHD